MTDTAVSVYTIPTDHPKSDGTLEWTSTTIVIVEVGAGRLAGLGCTYAHKAAATLTAEVMRPDLSRPGCGFEFKRADATRYAA